MMATLELIKAQRIAKCRMCEGDIPEDELRVCLVGATLNGKYGNLHFHTRCIVEAAENLLGPHNFVWWVDGIGEELNT